MRNPAYKQKTNKLTIENVGPITSLAKVIISRLQLAFVVLHTPLGILHAKKIKFVTYSASRIVVGEVYAHCRCCNTGLSSSLGNVLSDITLRCSVLKVMLLFFFHLFYLVVGLKYLPPSRRLCFRFVCLLAELCENYQQQQKIVGKVARGPRKNPLDFGGNQDYFTLGLGFRITVDIPRHTRQDRVTVRLWPGHTPIHWVYFSRRLILIKLDLGRGIRCTECPSRLWASISADRGTGTPKNWSEGVTNIDMSPPNFLLVMRMTSCAGSRAICPRPCTPHAAAQLQPIHALRLRRPARLAPWIFTIDRQRLALGGGVDYGVVHINYVVTWTANQSGLVTLTFDLLTLKVVSQSRVTLAISLIILVFLGLSVLDLGPMYATDMQTDVRRQTDVRQRHRLNPRLLGAGT